MSHGPVVVTVLANLPAPQTSSTDVVSTVIAGLSLLVTVAATASAYTSRFPLRRRIVHGIRRTFETSTEAFPVLAHPFIVEYYLRCDGQAAVTPPDFYGQGLRLRFNRSIEADLSSRFDRQQLHAQLDDDDATSLTIGPCLMGPGRTYRLLFVFDGPNDQVHPELLGVVANVPLQTVHFPDLTQNNQNAATAYLASALLAGTGAAVGFGVIGPANGVASIILLVTALIPILIGFRFGGRAP